MPEPLAVLLEDLPRLAVVMQEARMDDIRNFVSFIYSFIWQRIALEARAPGPDPLEQWAASLPFPECIED